MKTISREQAIEQLLHWPRWTRPSEKWLRKTLVRTGAAGPNDVLTTNESIITDASVPQHERPFLALLRRVARIAGAEVDVRKFTALCGVGTISKRFAFVRIPRAPGDPEDFVHVVIVARLDCENRTVRDMLETRLGAAGES